MSKKILAVFVTVLALSSVVKAQGNASSTGLVAGRGFAATGDVAEVPLLVSTDVPVHGFIMVLEWDVTRGVGQEVVANDGPGGALEEADIVVTFMADDHLIFAASLDSDSMDCEHIPSGESIELGTAHIRCLPVDGADPNDVVETPVRFVDDRFALTDEMPDLSNMVLEYARFMTRANGDLTTADGSLVCTGVRDPGGTAFACGGPIQPNGRPIDVEANLGDRVPVCFYYRSPEVDGEGNLLSQIQGFSMAGVYDCSLTPIADSFSVAGTVLEDAEFIHLQLDTDNTSADGDGCEFTLGVLVDSTEPFDGRKLPYAEEFTKLFTLDFEVGIDAFCGECLPIRFMDGPNGNGDVPVKNLVSLEFEAEAPLLFNCAVCVTGRPEFIRGDCNFSGEIGMGVDLADAAALVGFAFIEGEWKFDAPCEDACDANDDGRIDAADVVFLLDFLFIADRPAPPAPGPLSPGTDPTDDELSCDGGIVVCE